MALARKKKSPAPRRDSAPKSVGNPSTLSFEPVPAIGGKGALARNRIALAAIELFGAYGYEGTSTRVIAKRIGIRHSLLLYHFKSKRDLWIAVLRAVIEDYRTRIQNNIGKASSRDPTVMLRIFIEQHVRFLADVPQIHLIMTMEGTQNSDRLKWIFEAELRDHERLMINLIRRCQTAGTVRKMDPARLYFAILGVCGQLFAIAPEFKLLSGKNLFSEDEIRKTIAFIGQLVFEGE